MKIAIRESESGAALAEAELGPGLAKYEGNWYFDPTAVNSSVLSVTAHLHLPDERHLQLG